MSKDSLGDPAAPSGSRASTEPADAVSAVPASIPIAVGTTLYIFDHNRRRYGPDRSIVYRHHFEPAIVTRETSRSWIVGEGHGERKVSKADMRISLGKWGNLRAYTASGMEENIWAFENRRRVVGEIERCDVPMLRAVATLLAQGMAAGTGETACGLDPKGNSPVGSADAPEGAST